MPYYAGLKVGVPSLPSVVEALSDGRYDLLHLCTPGPAGIAAALTGRLLGLPTAGSYHTELAAYAGLRSGDAGLKFRTDLALAAFYGQCDVVLSPSTATRRPARRARHPGGADRALGPRRRPRPLLARAPRAGAARPGAHQRPLRRAADAREGRRPARRRVPRGAPPAAGAAARARRRRPGGGDAARAARRRRDLPRLARGRRARRRLRVGRPVPVLLADRHLRPGAARGPGLGAAGRGGRRGRPGRARRARAQRPAVLRPTPRCSASRSPGSRAPRPRAGGSPAAACGRSRSAPGRRRSAASRRAGSSRWRAGAPPPPGPRRRRSRGGPGWGVRDRRATGRGGGLARLRISRRAPARCEEAATGGA